MREFVGKASDASLASGGIAILLSLMLTVIMLMTAGDDMETRRAFAPYIGYLFGGGVLAVMGGAILAIIQSMLFVRR